MSSKKSGTTAKSTTKTKTNTAKAKTTAKAKPKTAKEKTTEKSKPTANTSAVRSELARAVAAVSEVYRSNAMGVGVDGHTSMTFTGTHLRANTFAAAIKFPLKTKFKANVNGPMLAKIVNSFDSRGSGDIRVSIKKETMTISSGKANVDMSVVSTTADEVADLSGAVKFKVDADTRAKIVLALSQALTSAGTKDPRYHLNGVHFHNEKGKLIIMASEGHAACRVNTGIKGADKFDGLSLTRDTVESFIATASLIDCDGDTMLMTRNKDNKGVLFGWQFSNGAEFCALVMDKPETFDITTLMEKLEEFNVDKLPSVSTPDGLVDAVLDGQIAATKGSPVLFSVKGGVMSVKTGDEGRGLVYTTSDIATEIKDTEVAYNLDLIAKVIKNPADQILFYNDGPLYIGDVDAFDNDSVGVQTFIMPVRV